MPDFASTLAQIDTLAASFAARADAHDHDGSFPHENVEALRAAGAHRMPVPLAYGGDGISLPQAVRVIEHVGVGDASTALGLAMHMHVIGGPEPLGPMILRQK